jgi:DNA-binding GntR family transcriptional regulator
MARAFTREATPARIKALREHIAQEKSAVDEDDGSGRRMELLGDFHVRIAELMGNEVLAQILRDLVSRSSLITLMYQRAGAARHSQQEHVELVRAFAARDEDRAARLMDDHLLHVEASLAFDRPVPTHDVALALS